MTTPNTQLVTLLKESKRIFVFTGAGISTNSGIPDFRGPSGVWKTKQPVTYQEFMGSEVKRIEYWDWKVKGYETYSQAKPNSVHTAIRDLDQTNKLEMLVTQNVDGLHSKTGISPDKLVEIHGTNGLVQCMSCMTKFPPHKHYAFFTENRIPPICKCGGILKPATISFGQNLIQEDMERAGQSAMNSDLVVSLGSTLAVYPAASFPLMAADGETPYIIVNRGQTDQDNLPEVTLRLEGDVSDIFPPAVHAAIQI